jgi:hypothetical protein
MRRAGLELAHGSVTDAAELNASQKVWVAVAEANPMEEYMSSKARRVDTPTAWA